MWPFKRKPIEMVPEEPYHDPDRVLIAVSKPGVYSYTVKGKYSYENKKIDVLIRLYMSGTTRSWAAFESGQETPKSSHEMDFWVDTGKFSDPKIEQGFEWILSPRELKKKLLAELIAMDVDPPKDDE